LYSVGSSSRGFAPSSVRLQNATEEEEEQEEEEDDEEGDQKPFGV